MAAYELASAGHKTLLLDEKMAWEKPCGGGVTWKAYSQYPFLLAGRSHRVDATWLHATATSDAELQLEKPLLIFSRRDLNQLLLDRAAHAGAELLQTRVTGLTRQGESWQLTTRSGSLAADHLIVATGARNPLRDFGTAFTAADSMVALGYYVPATQLHIDIQFFAGLEGYIWLFPRQDHLSAGICGKGFSAAELRQRLEAYLKRRGLAYENAPFYAHMLPALDVASWAHNRLAGPAWTAVGDAAGLVDPITGEGIYYAMRSGELAGQLVSAGRPEAYAPTVQQEFGDDLAYASTLARRVYLGRFCGGANTTRMLQFLRRSPRIQAVMQELFAGTISYHELRRRIRGNFKSTMAEIAINTFLRRIVSA
jgi:flavin-dependent dehydrogenase